MRVRLAVGDHFALLHLFAFEHVEMAPLRNQLLVLVGASFRRDDQTALALGFLAEADRTERSARIAESFGLRASNRSATRGRPPVMSRVLDDSCGIRAMTSPTDTFRTVLEADDGARRQRVHRRNVGVGEGDFLALGIDQTHDRTQVLAARAALLRIQHHGAGQTGDVRPPDVVTVMPSTKSENLIMPATSVTTGWVCGSQLATD